MEKSEGLVGNTYSVQPREVSFGSGESETLAYDIRQAIDESFLFANYSETLATISPLELYLPTQRNDTFNLLTLGMTYDRANIQTTIDHGSTGSMLRTVDVRLFHEKWGNAAQSVLTAKAGDIDRESEALQEMIDPENPLFHITAPIDLKTLERERNPLNYLMYRDMLNYVVSLAHPVASITNPDRSLLQSVEALIATSTETSLSRSAKYRFHQDEDETIEVGVHDRALVYLVGEPKHIYHEVTVKRIRAFGKAGSLATHMNMKVTQSGIEATVGKEFCYEDDCIDDIELQAEALAGEYQTVSAGQPKEFGRQILDSIALLRSAGVYSENIIQLD